MRYKINENENWFDITMLPDTVEEMAMLARFAKNAKQEKPNIVMSFNNEPYLSIEMKKVDKGIQSNRITPKDRNH